MVKVGQGGQVTTKGVTHLDSVGPASADELAAWAKERQRKHGGAKERGRLTKDK